MTIALLPAPCGPALREVRAAQAPAIASDGLWPRLLAHVDADGIEVAIERGDRRLTHPRRLPRPAWEDLGANLKAYVAAAGAPVAAGAIVVDGPVAAGRFQPRAAARATGIENLRDELGLRALWVLDERTALGRSLRLPPAGELRWLLAPRVASARATTAAAVCRLGSDGRAALLAPVVDSGQAALPALMNHPFAPVDPDELIVVASMRARGIAPVFGNLLGTDGIARAFEALAGIDYDSAWPLAADGVVSLAWRDERARRACAVICAAIAQLCALLSFDGVRRVLLAGRAAALLAPALARYPIAERLHRLCADAAEPATDVALGVLFTPIRFLEGARASLEEALRDRPADVARTLQARVGERYPHLTPSSRRVADVVLDDASFVIREPIAAIAGRAVVSTSQVSRFGRALGFGGLIELKLALVANQARAQA